MAKPEAVFIYIGTYPDKAAAEVDYEVVRDLHAAGVVGTYDVGVVTKDEQGKVHIHQHELAARLSERPQKMSADPRRHFPRRWAP